MTPIAWPFRKDKTMESEISACLGFVKWYSGGMKRWDTAGVLGQ